MLDLESVLETYLEVELDPGWESSSLQGTMYTLIHS